MAGHASENVHLLASAQGSHLDEQLQLAAGVRRQSSRMPRGGSVQDGVHATRRGKRARRGRGMTSGEAIALTLH